MMRHPALFVAIALACATPGRSAAQQVPPAGWERRELPWATFWLPKGWRPTCGGKEQQACAGSALESVHFTDDKRSELAVSVDLGSAGPVNGHWDVRISRDGSRVMVVAKPKPNPCREYADEEYCNVPGYLVVAVAEHDRHYVEFSFYTPDRDEKHLHVFEQFLESIVLNLRALPPAG